MCEPLLKPAITLAERILDARQLARDGTFTWLAGRGYGTPESPFVIRKMGPHVYNGTSGVALFLAAAARVGGDKRFRDSARMAIVPVRRKMAEILEDPEKVSGVNVAVGGLIGLGSILYAFFHLAEWLEEPSLLDEAHALSSLITDERIAEDNRFRIQHGSAGAILALLALHRARPEPNRAGRTPLEIAQACGRHLVRGRTSHEGRPRAWHIAPGLPSVCDFCYGSSGIRYALLRLFEAAPDLDLRDAAEEALAFERSLYSPEAGNWIETRFPGRVLQTNWCHGSAGLALGHAAGLDVSDGPEVREEIERALDLTMAHVRNHGIGEGCDDMCCGNIGRVEVLHSLSRRLGDSGLLEIARRLASQVVARAEQTGGYRLTSARGRDLFDPSLFQGAAGIGYTLLRLADPEALPCLLLME